MRDSDIVWCLSHFKSLSEGGTWAVPRSGLIFSKKGQKLVLTALMPYDPAMPVSAEQLKQVQDEDYEAIKEHFNAAGIEVKRES